MVFDGAVATTAVQTADASHAADPATSDARSPDATSGPDSSDAPDVLAVAPTAASSDPSSRVIVFIDGAVRDSEVIAAAVPPGAEVVFLDKDKDGVEQIASVLATRTDITALHIVSHGQSGVLYLGDAALDVNSITSEYADELALIKSALSENGDILLYGCDVASGDRGEAFIQAFADATASDVAASSNATGASNLGGDWSLEVESGLIEVRSISAVNWDHLLAPISIANLNGTTLTAGTLADNVAGAGITVVSASYSGANSQAGTFTSATGYPAEWLAFDSGVILSSGSTTSVIGSNTSTSTTVDAPGTGTDADFTAIGGGITSYDAASLTVQFIPTSNKVTLQFVLGSEEYNEYVYANFNDALGVWVNGQHVSLTPAGREISIDTINQAATFNPSNGNQSRDPFPSNGVFDSASPSLFVNNSTGAYTTQMDGFTVTLSLVANVNIGQVNTIKIGVADIGDAQYDTWLFVRENSLQATTIANTDYATTNTNTSVVINPLSNDTDSDGDPLMITHVADKPITAGGPAITLASGGTVQLTVSGTIIYTPPTGYAGYEDFSYTISDGNGTTAVGFVHIDIGSNSPPIIDLNDNGTSSSRDNSVTYNEGSAAVSVAAATAVVIDSNDISYTELNLTLGGFQSTGAEVVTIGGASFTYGTAQSSFVNINATTFHINYDGANGFQIRNAAPDTEMPDGNVERLIRSVTYRHDNDVPVSGARTLTFQVSDGLATSNAAVATVNVVAINDAPVNTLPATYTSSTTSSLALTGLAIADADAGSAVVSTTLSVSNGTLTAVAAGGVTVSGSGTGSITLTGSVSAINSFLATSAPLFASVSPGNVTLTMVTNDGGNTGSGGALTDTDTATITVISGPTIDLNSGPTTVNLTSTGGGFGTSASGTPPSPWVEGSAGNGAVVLNGTDGRWAWTTGPSANATLSYALTPPVGSALTSISFGLAWQNEDNNNANTLTVSYGGLTYATLTTARSGGRNAAGLTGTWTYSNGASGPATTSSVTDEVTGTLTTITINLPLNVAAPGSLVFTYGDAAGGGNGTNHDDIAIDNVVVTATIPDSDRNWSAAFTEGGSPVAIADVDSSIFDIDSANMSSATIVLTNAQAGDRFRVGGAIVGNGSTGTINGLSYVVTEALGQISIVFSGSAARGVYADTIEAISFENVSEAPSAVVRTIHVTVSDGSVNSNTAVSSITVTPVNDAPVASERQLHGRGRRLHHGQRPRQ